MEFSDLKAFFPYGFKLLEMEVGDGSLFNEGDIVGVNGEEFRTLSTTARNGGERKECRACFKNKRYELDYRRNSVCRIKQINGNNVVVEMLYNAELDYDDALSPEGMAVAVVDEALKGSSVRAFGRLIEENYTVRLGEEVYYLFGKFIGGDGGSFILVDAARKKFVTVKKKSFAELGVEDGNTRGKEMLVIENGERSLCNFSSYRFTLHRIGIRFVDKTEKTRVRNDVIVFISDGGAGYVKIWDKYSDVEFNGIEKKFNDAGRLEFTSVRVDKNLNPVFTVRNGGAVCAFKEAVSEAFDGQVVILNERGKTVCGGEIKASAFNRRNEITIEVSGDIFCRSGSIIPNMLGSKIQYQRRKNAANAILKGEASNPCLAYVLSGTIPRANAGEAREKLPLDEKIIRDVFGEKGANDSQREAIETAINTPDIAIIQGPPGTGKTRVIRAIFAHLQKYERNKEDAETQYLITAYQNDATLHAVEGAKDSLGLPILSIAGKNSDEENLRQLDYWCRERAEAVKERSCLGGKLKNKEIIRRLELSARAFDEPCGYRKAIEVLRAFLRDTDDYCAEAGSGVRGERFDNEGLDEAFITERRKAERLLREFEAWTETGDAGLLKYYISALPSTETEAKDGMEIVREAIGYVSGDSFYAPLMKEQTDGLKEILKKQTLEKEDFRRLQAIKVKMALKLGQKDFLSEADRKRAAEVIRKVTRVLDEGRLREKDQTLLDYIDGMQPTEELKQAVKEYRDINAATHQKTLSKELYTGGALPRFKAVLVDEAARSCPSDLLIPLACSAGKIVLVGDEKQLPQFLNADTVRALESQLDRNDLDALKSELEGGEKSGKSIFTASMFEYLLKNVAEKLKRRDAHERAVMLKTQYRMPPTLGHLVSKQFYGGELKNGDGLDKNGGVPERFRQSYPVIGGQNLVWLDVPSYGNKAKPSGTSYWRQSEIDAIFHVLAAVRDRFVRDNAEKSVDKKSTIGIITGYRAQKERIDEALDGEEWAALREFIEVGTVDSFQGKEFDIVFLSVVRTDGFGFMSIRETAGDFKLPRAGKERTCVALSRAKKCMIVVGDSAMVSGKNEAWAKGEVPALVEYFKYCEQGRDGVCKIIRGGAR